MSKTTRPTDITPRTGSVAVHGFLSTDAHNEWHAAADTHGLSMTAILEALAPRIAGILAAEQAGKARKGILGE